MSEHATIHVMRLIFASTIMRQYAIIYFEYGQFNRCGNIYPLVYLSKHLISNGNILRKNSPLPNKANTHRISYLTNLFWQDQSYRMSYSMGFIRTDTFQAGKLCVFFVYVCFVNAWCFCRFTSSEPPISFFWHSISIPFCWSSSFY